MNIVKLLNFARFSRRDFLVFSPEYLSMLEQLKLLLQTAKQIQLCLVRMADKGLVVTLVRNFNVVSVEQNMFTVTFTDEQHEEPLTKVIRLDNVLGEIPLLPGFTKSVFVDQDKFSTEYKSFLKDVKDFFAKHINQTLSIVYKNDDGTYSVIDGIVKEANHGNFKLRDLSETLVKDNKTVCRSPQDRDKFHRFISEKGFLCQIMLCNRSVSNEDDEQVFGGEITWNFPENQMVAA